MVKTKVLKVEMSGEQDIMITLRKGTFWGRYRGSMTVTLLSLGHWSKYEYKEKVRGSYPLLHELFCKFEEKEAISFIRRYLAEVKRKSE